MKDWTQAQIEVMTEVLLPVINGQGYRMPIILYDFKSGMVSVRVDNELNLSITVYIYDKTHGDRIKETKKCAYWRWRSYPTIFEILTILNQHCPKIHEMVIAYPE